jgi:threonine synthase
MGLDAMAGAPDEPTAAEGVRVPRPARAAEVLGAIRNSGGEVLAVDEDQILPARERLARMGFFVEPTCALVLDAFLQHGAGWPGPVAAILTGSGLKSP